MTDPLMILNVLNINPKSFEVELNSNFEANDSINVYCLTDTSKNIYFSNFINFKNSSYKLITIILSQGSELISNYKYKVTITREGKSYSYEFNYVNFPAITDCNIKTFGDRIIEISFSYPIKNLDKSDITTNTLQNFYALYFHKDINASNTATPNWVGFFTLSSYLNVDISSDLKTLTIQSIKKGFPIGNHSMIINYSKSQNSSLDTNIVLCDYNTKNRIVPVMLKDFTISKNTFPVKAVNIEIFSSTVNSNMSALIISFDGAILLKNLNDMNVLSTNGSPINTFDVLRFPGTYNKLIYFISSLPFGNHLPITVGSLIDANGYYTEEKTFYPIASIRNT